MVERSRSGFTYRGNTQPQYQRGSILKTANRTKAFVDTLPNTMASFNNAVDTDMRSSIFDIMEKLQKEELVTPVTRSDGFGATDMERGKIFPVSQDTRVNEAQAKQDLDRRIKTDFLPIIKNNIGDSWDGLSNNAKGAIMSITYNYGRVPKRIRAAINTGNTDKISAAIRSLAKDDEGINKNRRLAEAELVMLPDFNSDSLMKKRNK